MGDQIHRPPELPFLLNLAHCSCRDQPMFECYDPRSPRFSTGHPETWGVSGRRRQERKVGTALSRIRPLRLVMFMRRGMTLNRDDSNKKQSWVVSQDVKISMESCICKFGSIRCVHPIYTAFLCQYALADSISKVQWYKSAQQALPCPPFPYHFLLDIFSAEAVDSQWNERCSYKYGPSPIVSTSSSVFRKAVFRTCRNFWRRSHGTGEEASEVKRPPLNFPGIFGIPPSRVEAQRPW